MTRPVFMDCDTGIDDAMALGLLLRSPEAELVGVGSVSGNISAAQAARNTLDVLALAGHPDVPVAVGAHHPQAGEFAGGPAHIHGGNGIGGVELSRSDREPVAEDAADLLIRAAKAHPGELSLITIGPLTNVAEALRREPELPSLVREVTTMGGAAMVPGNISPVAEANIWNDAEAAAEVVAAPWDLTLVPLDVTLENHLGEADREALLAADDPLPRAIGAMLDVYFGFYSGLYGRRGCALHDPLAAAIALGLVTATRAPAVPLVVDATHGPGRGQTIADLRGQRLGPVDRPGERTRVVLDTDRPLGPLLVERLVS